MLSTGREVGPRRFVGVYTRQLIDRLTFGPPAVFRVHLNIHVKEQTVCQPFTKPARNVVNI